MIFPQVTSPLVFVTHPESKDAPYGQALQHDWGPSLFFSLTAAQTGNSFQLNTEEQPALMTSTGVCMSEQELEVSRLRGVGCEGT